MVWSPQPLLLKAAAVLAAADTEGQYSLFNHSSLGVSRAWSHASASTGSAMGSVHDSSFVALLPWLGLLGFNMGHVVDHMMKLGSVTWEGVGAKVRRGGTILDSSQRARGSRSYNLDLEAQAQLELEVNFDGGTTARLVLVVATM